MGEAQDGGWTPGLSLALLPLPQRTTEFPSRNPWREVLVSTNLLDHQVRCKCVILKTYESQRFWVRNGPWGSFPEGIESRNPEMSEHSCP